jgi:hypothetical protein
MRTTVTIEDGLLTDAKRVAAETGRTLGEVVEDALRESLARRRELRSSERPPLPTFEGDGLQPGVDLDDTAALLDLMERGG